MARRPSLDSSSSPWRAAIAGLLAMAAALGIGRFVYTPILPPMAADLGLTKAQAGWIASANYVGYLIGALLAARPSLSRHAQRWLLLALAVSGLTTCAMGLADGLWAFAALRLIGGIASAFVMVYAAAVVLRHLQQAKRDGLSAIHFAGVGVGVAASAVVVSLATALGADWRELWIASGLVALIAGAVAGLMLPPVQDAPSSPTLRIWPARGLAPLLLAYGLFGFGYVITATFLVSIVREAPAARPLEPVVWLLVGLSAAPSIAFWTWVSGRIGEGRAFALACLIEAAGVAASVLAQTVWGAGLAAIFLGGTYMGITALGLQAARHRSADAAKAIGLMTAAFGLGQIVGPVFAGEMARRTGGLTMPSLVAAGGLLVGAALTIGLDARVSPMEHRETAQ